jgi:hypothetical protein
VADSGAMRCAVFSGPLITLRRSTEWGLGLTGCAPFGYRTLLGHVLDGCSTSVWRTRAQRAGEDPAVTSSTGLCAPSRAPHSLISSVKPADAHSGRVETTSHG